MSYLYDYFSGNKQRAMHKWTKYFDVYESHFSKFRNKKINVLEIGVQNGGSLEMWRDYFGKDANIYGIDINPLCKKVEGEQIKVFIGNQSDVPFLMKCASEIGKIDIIIDDGSHFVAHQITTFNALYPILNINGIYLIEDVHTSYWREYIDTSFNQETFIDFSKRCVDSLNAFASRTGVIDVNEITNTTDSICFHESIVVFEKAGHKKNPDIDKVTGNIFDVVPMVVK